MYSVIKRDGRKTEFNPQKIENAVLAAFKEVDGEITEYAKIKASNIAKYIANYTKNTSHELTIEEISDLAEKGLMSGKRKDVAKAYINYRKDRERMRIWNNKLMKNIKIKIDASDVQNQNANVDEYSFGGRKGEADSAMLKQLALDTLMSKKVADNHRNNRSYTHDLDSWALGMHNCLSIPFDDILDKGFITRQTDVRGANSINTAFQLVAVIMQLQSLQQFGGVASTHIDWTLVPYIRKSFLKHIKDGLKYIEKISNYKIERFERWLKNDKEHPDNLIHFDDEKFKSLHPEAWNYAMDMTTRETEQAAEGLYHNLNTLQSRSGNQLPFSSINYGTCTLPEGRMINKAILDKLIEGTGKHKRTSIFPCGIFKWSKEKNAYPGTPNYDLYQLAIKATAKRLYPNYANTNWSGNAGYDPDDPATEFSTMGCRTANGADINALPGQNPQLKDGRGNIAPATVIMPTIAMEALQSCQKKFGEFTEEQAIEEFMLILEQVIEETKDGLIERFEYIASQDPRSATFMYQNGLMFGYNPKEGIRSALKHGTLAIGNLGLAETLQILVGCNQTKPKGLELGKRIYQLFKDKCMEYKQTYKLNFGVYMTPAENLAYTAMLKFKKQYGEIPDISDREYFTNSCHIPVWEKISPFDKIDIEAELAKYSSAGCITYVELEGDILNNPKALEQIINYAMEKDIPYFAINVPADLCDDCGYQGLIGDTCPECGSSNVQQLRRVTGYLTGDYKTAFNPGKQAEVRDRFKHSKMLV